MAWLCRLVYAILDILSGDIEANSGSISGQSFSICHWNLNSISANNFTEISFLTAYVLVHNFDIICLSEIYLNSETSTDDKNVRNTWLLFVTC